MKVAMLHWAFPPIIGGVESHLAMLGPELVRYGCQVSLLTGSVNGAEKEYVWQGMKIYRRNLFDLNNLNPSLLRQKAKEITEEVGRFIEKEKPDIIHAHNMHYFSPEHADALFAVKNSLDIPLVLTAHNVWADDLWTQFNARAHYWDAVIAVSHYIKRELVRAGYPDKRITVIHHGIDLELFKPDRDNSAAGKTFSQFAGRRVIFHPARMSLAKGSHISVQALAQIRERFPDVLLVLAGTEKTVDWGSYQGEEVSRIKNLVAELDLAGHVYIEFFPWEKMPLVYRDAEICIYPSCFEEPFGLVMLEAMASAKPIVVSRAGGMPEVVKDRVCGFVVPMNDPRELAGRCCQLLAEPALARQMGETGRKIAQKSYPKELMAARTLHVYGDLLSFYWRRRGSSAGKKFIA
ncbi:MAG: glycosyltransferase family 4 protein [Bacillota bacterium]